jgi:hypothetical protein
MLAFGIGVALMGGGMLLVGDASRTEALTARILQWTVILAVGFLWNFSYSLAPRRHDAEAGAAAPARAR